MTTMIFSSEPDTLSLLQKVRRIVRLGSRGRGSRRSATNPPAATRSPRSEERLAPPHRAPSLPGAGTPTGPAACRGTTQAESWREVPLRLRAGEFLRRAYRERSSRLATQQTNNHAPCPEEAPAAAPAADQDQMPPSAPERASTLTQRLSCSGSAQAHPIQAIHFPLVRFPRRNSIIL